MNVKRGDIAIIISGRQENIGRLVYVAKEYGDVDYSHFGYGILMCWTVESLGSDLMATDGPVQAGFTPDRSLKIIELPPECAAAMRKAKAEADFKAAITELANLSEKYLGRSF